MQTCQLNHVALHVLDVDRSCEFYDRVLKLEQMPRPAFNFPGVWYRLGVDQELHLIGERPGDQTPLAGSRSNHFALMIDDMDAWEAHFQSIDQSYLPRRIRPDGAFQIYIADPDGHYIELMQPEK